ncbi:MAG: hypothetical protein LBJ59_02625 [Zoogloeaceae bacterium]|jgi:hypothetical protein|nr:hypothetical protein [Zoogloeaceae bacterium]
MKFSKFIEMLETPVKNASEKYPLLTLIILCLFITIAPAIWILAGRVAL